MQSLIAVALAMGIGLFAPGAFAQDNGYVQAPVSGVIVKDPFGLCWRTGYWTPAMATMECDPDLVPKKAEPAPAPVVAPPAPAPAADARAHTRGGKGHAVGRYAV